MTLTRQRQQGHSEVRHTAAAAELAVGAAAAAAEEEAVDGTVVDTAVDTGAIVRRDHLVHIPGLGCHSKERQQLEDAVAALGLGLAGTLIMMMTMMMLVQVAAVAVAVVVAERDGSGDAVMVGEQSLD